MSTRLRALTPLDQWRLSVACEPICEWLGTPYLVGSVWDRRDPGDIDVRVILADSEFDALFGTRPGLWSLLCLATATYLQRETGLPIDFQVQRQTEANEKHPGKRSALGLPKDVFAGGGDGTRWERSDNERTDAGPAAVGRQMSADKDVCNAIEPGNWSRAVPTCRLPKGHDGDHEQPPTSSFPARRRWSNTRVQRESHALSWLIARLDAADEAGEFGQCCANPSCRACNVLAYIAEIAREYPQEGQQP